MLLNKIDRIISWNNISILGKSKFIQSFSIWFIITPIIAKVFEKVNNINILGGNFNVKMPFTFEIFYLCSLFFLIANLIYLFKCPNLIKNYLNASDFIKQETKEAAEAAIDLELKKCDGIGIAPYLMLESSQRFVKICDDIKLLYNGYRRLISIIYLIGILLFMYIIFENIYFVFNIKDAIKL